MAYEFDDGRVVCEQCGESFARVGQHWSLGSTCDHPPLSDTIQDVLIGSLMGDGCVHGKDAKNQRLAVKWSSEQQCGWLHDVLGWLSTGVRLKATAEEAAKQLGSRELNGPEYESDPDNFSDVYQVRTRSHPFITTLTDWYGVSGYDNKEWPADIDLTPTVLLLWFVGDGNYNDNTTHRHMEIRLDNEADNTEKVQQYFDRAGLPRASSTGDGSDFQWTVAGSKSLFDYMDQSPLLDDGLPRGFEYKFPNEYGGTGKSLADVEPAVHVNEIFTQRESTNPTPPFRQTTLPTPGN